jgi:glycosyltransferase involved in cell wall biosynthesis
LDSLVAQVDAPEFELLVVTNGRAEIDEAIRKRFPDAAIVPSTGMRPGGARNVLIEKAAGEMLLFLDDDVLTSPDMLRRLADLDRTHPGVDVFGGPNLTPPRSTFFQKVQGAVLGSIVTAGPVRRRYGRHPAGPADERFFILCNMAVRTREMARFDPDLICAEENELLAGMASRDLQMHYDPDLAVYHERRDTLRGLVAQMYKYGRGRGQVIRRHPGTVRLAYCVPALFIAYLLAAAILWPFDARVLLPLALYGVVVLAGAAKVARSMRSPASIATAALLIIVVHVFYGLGVWRGLFGRVGRRKTGTSVTRESGKEVRVSAE